MLQLFFVGLAVAMALILWGECHKIALGVFSLTWLAAVVFFILDITTVIHIQL